MWRRLFSPGREGTARNFGLFLLRVSFAAALILGHGWGKLLSYGHAAEDFADPLGIGSGLSMALVIFAEVFCAAALLLGFMGRLATVPLVVNFAVAFFLQHGGDPFGERELAFAYLVAFIVLLITGPGRFSLDHLLRRR